MTATRAYAIQHANAKFAPFDFTRRALTKHDILIKIHYCGICHSDIHQARNEWQNSTYPMVPGHEIVGEVISIGSEVHKFKVGDLVGVGCFVDSCRQCASCKESEEQLCDKHTSWTYNGFEQDLKTPTYGGYSNQIVIDEHYALHISKHLPLANVAPLLCAGITTYSPLKRYKVGPGQRVGVIGLGGLGHMAVKLAASMGAEVTVLSTSPAKQQDALKLGAQHFLVTKDPHNLQPYTNHFNFIIDTVSAEHDLNIYLNLLAGDGVLTLVGIPEKPFSIMPFSLIAKRRILTGSLIGGLRETQEMLDYCAQKNISADIELIPIQQIEEAYARTIKGDVRYRFVIDMKSLA